VGTIVFRAGRLLPIGLVILLLSHGALAQPSLEYRNRGDRYEGVRGLPVSGYTIELLSFRALYQEPVATGGLPPLYRVRFFLDKATPAYLVVREIDNKYSYWLDNVKPKASWVSGYNVFEWPTKDVIAGLSNLKLYDLGVIVRVGTEVPASMERVAPAILYHSITPPSILGYEFAFKANVTAGYEFRVERGDGTMPKSQPEPRELRKWSYGVPFRVRLDASNVEPGKYLLKIRGRVLENNETFTQEVEFQHQPKMQ
jgi:hypothetical protein